MTKLLEEGLLCTSGRRAGLAVCRLMIMARGAGVDLSSPQLHLRIRFGRPCRCSRRGGGGNRGICEVAMTTIGIPVRSPFLSSRIAGCWQGQVIRAGRGRQCFRIDGFRGHLGLQAEATEKSTENNDTFRTDRYTCSRFIISVWLGSTNS